MKDQALGRMKQGVMNKTEQAYNDYLTSLLHAGEIKWFKFEGIKLRLADGCFYNPDFAVLTKDNGMEIHEVKGFFRDKAKVKVKVAADMYPFVFKVIFKEAKKRGGGWRIEEF